MITFYYTGEKDQEGATADGNADTEEELEDRPEGLGLVHGDDYEYEGDDSQDFSEVGSIQGDDANSPNKKVHTIKGLLILTRPQKFQENQPILDFDRLEFPLQF